MATLIVLTTAPQLSEARRIAKVLLENKLAACVTISGAVTSHYRWKGKIERAREYMLMIKTRRALFSKLEKTLRKIHSYEVPEILGLSITAGSKRYLDWIKKSVSA